ncbi:MAG: 6-bladed beta-propeller, partial [Balneolaceae bacterium]
MKREFVLILLCTGFILSCSSSPEIEIPEEIADMENVAIFSSDDEPSHSIEFERVTSYGDTDDLFVGQMRGAAVDQSGRVYLADDGEKKVHIYEPDGAHIQSVGGEGEGPGEFRFIAGPLVYNNHLYVMDFMQRRISAFQLDDNSFDFALNMGENDSGVTGFPEHFTPLTNGNYFMVISSMDAEDNEYTRKPELYMMGENGEIVEKEILRFENERMITIDSGNGLMLLMPPYIRRTFVRSNNSEEIVSVNSDRMFIQFYDMDGSYKRAIYYSHSNVPLDRNRILDNYDSDEMKSALRKDTMPETMPTFSNVHTDDEDRMWFTMLTEEEDQTEYWLLDPEGERLAVFTWPEGKTIQTIRDNHIYTREEDEMGLNEIVKYR